MSSIIWIFAAILLAISSTDSFRFRNGRFEDQYGMLGTPYVQNNTDSTTEPINEQWFEQKLDHFEPTDARTWKQRYWMNFKYFDSKHNSPVFLLLGGESEASPMWFKSGQPLKNYAQHFNALGILLEHRYYGKSHPTPDMSTENLKYLTSEQALQDVAEFIGFINEKYNLTGDKNKWIVFGGSYSGSLAAWFRLKYPHLVSGAVASSAPIQAVLNFKEYFHVVEESLGPACVKQIKLATDELSRRLNSSDNWKMIEEKFKLCQPLDGHTKLDIQNLMENLAGNLAGVVQYNKDNRHTKDGRSNNITIDVLCGIMTGNENDAALDRLAKVNAVLLAAYSEKCFKYKYEDSMDELREIDFKKTGPAASFARLWTYQTCTEFGFFQTSDFPGQPFGDYFPLEFYVQQCVDAFGPKFKTQFIRNAVDFTNNMYGGFNLSLTNTIFPNGLIDPWHALGMLKQINPTARPLIIKETAHCADLYSESDKDPESLREARKTIVKTIASFLSSDRFL